MAATKIEWADAVWNPITGCTPVSEACDNCYAKRMANRLAGRYGYPADDPFRVTFHPDKLDEPLRWKKPRRIFVCSMGDLFHEDVKKDWIDSVWSTMAEARQHTFQVLTKRPERMREYILDRKRKGWKPDCNNIWLGVTAENQARVNERIPILLQIPAAVRFVSIEPMLGPVDLTDIVIKRQVGEDHIDVLRCDVDPADDLYHGSTLDWVICGGETGPGARPMHPDWVRSLRDQCLEAHVPFFFKGWGRWIQNPSSAGKRLLDGREWNEFPQRYGVV